MIPSPVDSLALAGLRPPALVLDLGCGTGSQATELADAGYRVVAADADFDAVSTGHALARDLEKGSDLPRFLVADARSLPFADARFDAVVCFDVLHWAEDDAAFRSLWREAWRVLGRGGFFQVRCLFRDALPTAVALGGGRYRLDTGAVWYLPSRGDLDKALRAGAGEWVVPPAAVGDTGQAGMTARKPA